MQNGQRAAELIQGAVFDGPALPVAFRHRAAHYRLTLEWLDVFRIARAG